MSLPDATDTHEPQALYAAVKRTILARIRSGAWPVRHRLPSESDLVSEFGVSRMTVNRALRELSMQGAIVRIQGVGSFVAAPKPHADLLEIRNIADEIAQRGGIYGADAVTVVSEAASPDIALSLGLADGEPVFHSVIVHREDGLAVQLEDRFVNPAAAPGYLDQDFTLTTPNAALSRVAPLSRAEHDVQAVLAEPWESRLLGIPAAEPCLVIQRRTWSGSLAVTTARLLYPGSRYRLHGRREIGR